MEAQDCNSNNFTHFKIQHFDDDIRRVAAFPNLEDPSKLSSSSSSSSCRSNFLAELVRREKLNHLVLNLYTDEQGYTIGVRINSTNHHHQSSKPPNSNGGIYGNVINNNDQTSRNDNSKILFETAKLSYEETSLLEFIDNEELPPLLIQLIDKSQLLCQYKIWHRGCLIIEVRDFRGACHNSDETKYHEDIISVYEPFDYRDLNQSELNHFGGVIYDNRQINGNVRDRVQQGSHTYPPSSNNFILLKPTNLSMFNDVINLMESQDCDTVWTFQDRLHLESQIILCNAPTLSLEPNETISSANGAHSHYQKDTDGRPRQGKIFRRRSLICRNRISNANPNKRLNLPSQLRLQHFIEDRNNRARGNNMEKFVSRLACGNRCQAKTLRNRTTIR